MLSLVEQDRQRDPQMGTSMPTSLSDCHCMACLAFACCMKVAVVVVEEEVVVGRTDDAVALPLAASVVVPVVAWAVLRC